jgi:hypothetical protein
VWQTSLRKETFEKTDNYREWVEISKLKKPNLPFYFLPTLEIKELLDLNRTIEQMKSVDCMSARIREYQPLIEQLILKYPGQLNLTGTSLGNLKNSKQTTTQILKERI